MNYSLLESGAGALCSAGRLPYGNGCFVWQSPVMTGVQLTACNSKNCSNSENSSHPKKDQRDTRPDLLRQRPFEMPGVAGALLPVEARVKKGVQGVCIFRLDPQRGEPRCCWEALPAIPVEGVEPHSILLV